MNLLSSLLLNPERRRIERAGFEIYAQTAAAARHPLYYSAYGVPDTLDGRFDLISLLTTLVIRRLRREPPPGPALAQAVFDAMFSGLDIDLREMGVGDMGVPRRVRAMWEALHGRAAAYEAALADGDPDRLAAALWRNVWRGGAPGAAAALAEHTIAEQNHLARIELAKFARGQVHFLGPAMPAGWEAAQ